MREVHYRWRFASSRLEGCPCALYHWLVGATLPDFERAAYVRGLVGSRPSASAALVASILYDDEGLIDRKLDNHPKLEAW
jgi:hypothetical protein